MKNLVMVLVFSFCFFWLNANVASDIFSKTLFGFSGGLNYSNVHGEKELKDFSPLSGYQAAVFLQYNLGVRTLFQVDLMYSKLNYNYDLPIYCHKDTYTYIHLPFNIKYELIQTNVFSQQIFFGPEIKYLINAERKTETNQYSYTEELSDVMNETDFGINAGIDFIFYKQYFLGLRYHISLNNSFYNTDLNLKTNSLMCNLGYYFN